MIILSIIIIIGFYLPFKGLGAFNPCNYTLGAFKAVYKPVRAVITVNSDHTSTTARPDDFKKRRQPQPLKAALYFCGLNSIVHFAQKPLFYRPDAVQRKLSKHMNISTYNHANYVKLDVLNSKIDKS